MKYPWRRTIYTPKPKVETRRVSPSSNKLDNEKRRHLKEKIEKRKKEKKK